MSDATTVEQVFEAPDPNFEDRIRDSFARQPFMAHCFVEMVEVGPGYVSLEVPVRPELTQQHGFIHGGLIGTLADNGCGYAAFTLMKAEDSVLTVEYKINILAPGRGDRLICRARVVKPGRRLMICQADVFAISALGEKQTEVHCATALGTLMVLADTPDHPQPNHSKG